MDLKDTVLQALNELVKNGGEGSGDFGHAGNPPHVGGSQPVEERKINKSTGIQKDKNKKSEEEKRQTDKEFSDRLTHAQKKEKVNKMKDEEIVREFISAKEEVERALKTTDLKRDELVRQADENKDKSDIKDEQPDLKRNKKEKYKLKEKSKITLKRFENLFDNGSYLENHQFRKTIVLDNNHQVEFDKKRGFITFYERGDLSKNKDYNAPKGTIGMIQKFRTDDYNKLVDYLFENNQEWRFNRNKANNSIYKHEYIEY